MTDSTPGKRARLVAAATELLYRQGIARTSLADIAESADVPVGNVYYYFKTKDDIVAAVVEERAAQLRMATGALQQRHRTPKARLKAMVAMLGDEREAIAGYGCPLGTLCTELARRPTESNDLAAPLMQILLDWSEQQFREMGRRDAADLAVELMVAYQGSALLTNALGQPELMARQTRRLEKWINAIEA